jgi:hypothetical protein
VVFSDEHDERHVRDTRDPGITNQLGVERKQSDGFFGIAAGRGLPVHDAPNAIEFADGVDVGNELIRVRQFAN